MQKLKTTELYWIMFELETELHWIIYELENAAEKIMQIAIKIEDNDESVFLRRKADLYSKLAKKLRVAINNEDKRIAIL